MVGGWRQEQPALRQVGRNIVVASHPKLGQVRLECEGATELLFTENESNADRLWGQANTSPYVKDAFHRYVIAGEKEAVNPAKSGTKAAAHYVLQVPAAESRVVRLRLSTKSAADAFSDFDQVFADRIADANEFFQR